MRRRSLLLGSAAVGLAAVAGLDLAVETDRLPGRIALHHGLFLEGPDGVVPDVAPGPVATYSFHSAARGTEVTYAIVRPPGHDGSLPLVVALHGQDGDHTWALALGLPRYLTAAVADGVPPFAIATVDGGSGYYHPHHGDDAGAMILDELLPRLAAHGLATDRIGLLGWSMGGYGALRLGGILGPDRVAAIAAISAALWTDPTEASRTGFDDATEYERYSVMGHQADLAGIPVRLEVGDGDPFRDADLAYFEGFPAGAPVSLRIEKGAHEAGYWDRMLPGDLAFLGSSLGA